jgi:hypothetical protein
VFSDYLWEAREHEYNAGVGTIYGTTKPYFGQLPSPKVGPLIGTPEQWVGGLSYADYVSGRLARHPCFPVTPNIPPLRIRQVETITTLYRNPSRVSQAQGVTVGTGSRIDQRQDVMVSPVVQLSVDQVQTVLLVRTATGSVDQVQTVEAVAGGPMALGQVQTVEAVAAGPARVDQVEAVLSLAPGPLQVLGQVQTVETGSAADLDQLQTVEQGTAGQVDQVQAVQTGTVADVDQLERVSAIPYTTACTSVPGTTHAAAKTWVLTVSGFVGADAHLNGTWTLNNTATCFYSDGTSTWSMNVNAPNTNVFANTSFGTIFYQLPLSSWNPLGPTAWPFGFGGPPTHPSQVSAIPVGYS